MAFTAGFSVNVGDPTKASDVDVLAANDDYLKNAIDTFIANDANNRVLTATGSGTANAESNLTFDGSTLTVTGTVSATTLSGNVTGGTISGTTGTFSGDLAVDTDTLFVDASADRVGVNNAAPSTPLHVKDASTAYVMAETTGTSTSAGFRLKGDASADYTIFTTQGVGSFGIYDNANAAQRLTIDTSGNMGLGVTPSAKVDIPIPSYNASTTAGMIRFTDSANSSHANIQGYYVGGQGSNLVIGTNAYLTTAEAWTRWSASYGSAALLFHRTGDIYFATGTNAGIPQSHMTLTSAGLLGIGTSSPLFLLDAKQATSGSTANLARFTNTSNTADSHARVIVSNGGTLGGDSFIQYITGNSTYTTGIDATDASFKIQYGSGVDPIFGSVGSTRLTIDSSGNVGISTSSPSGRLHVEGGGIYHIGSSLKYIASSSVQSISSTNNAGAELTTDAYLWINRSSAPCVFLNRTTTTGQIAVFYSDLTAVGSISVTASATAYNTSSDYRLKENLAPITGAVDRVNALQPRRFNFISDPNTTVDGFVAHEVSDIVPEAITGEKDAVDADGNPEYQGIDQSKLVPLLTAAIQELTARIEALEAA